MRVLFLALLVAASQAKDVELPIEYLDACTQGNIEHIKSQLAQHPTYLHGRSPQGETCLHLAAIMGQSAVTKVLLEAGADPNIRTTFERGQRMHPLSWNVYGGHVDNARLLLERGANPNLDIDWPKGGNPKMVPATVLDVIEDILPADDDVDNSELAKFYAMKQLLLEFGGRRYSELNDEL